MDDVTAYPVMLAAAELAARLLIALVFGAFVGVERQWHHKNAGIRTHALVSVGAATFGILSLLGFGPTNNPMLIAAAVVSGIGFIGGGVIMRRGATVQGINTAATLWATASMGLAVGGRYYALTCLVFIAVLTIQFPLRWVEYWVERRVVAATGPVTFDLTVRMISSATAEVTAALTAFAQRSAATIWTMTTRHDTDVAVLEAQLSVLPAHLADIMALNTTLAAIGGVRSAVVERAPGAEDAA